MSFERWHIQGRAFHFGRHGLGQEESGVSFPSDSLFAALIARLAAVQGAPAVPSWIEPFIKKDPPFVLSSTFPRAGRVYFFPRPMLGAGSAADDGTVTVKKLKKIGYVSQGIFEKLLSGVPLAALYNESQLLQDGSLLFDDAEAADLPADVRSGNSPVWQIERRPRVTIDRLRSSSTIYHTGRTVFGEDCGLWFAVQWLTADQAYKDQVSSLLYDLGDAGLGGERSSGFGQASLSAAGEFDLPQEKGMPWISLSRFLPAEDEAQCLLHPAAVYAFDRVSGWIDSPNSRRQRRRTLRMVREGSVLGPLTGTAPGQVVDVQPDYEGCQPLGHAVWRSGLALSVSCSGLQEGGADERI